MYVPPCLIVAIFLQDQPLTVWPLEIPVPGPLRVTLKPTTRREGVCYEDVSIQIGEVCCARIDKFQHDQL